MFYIFIKLCQYWSHHSGTWTLLIWQQHQTIQLQPTAATPYQNTEVLILYRATTKINQHLCTITNVLPLTTDVPMIPSIRSSNGDNLSLSSPPPPICLIFLEILAAWWYRMSYYILCVTWKHKHSAISSKQKHFILGIGKYIKYTN